MVDMTHEQPRPLQFTVRLLFIATTTCAVALAVMVRQPHPMAGMLGACVLLYWLGYGIMVAGEAVGSSRDWLLRIPAELLAALGGMLAVAAILSAGVLLVLATTLFLWGGLPRP